MDLKLCESCKIPLTKQEQADYVSLCEECASHNEQTEELLEQLLFDTGIQFLEPPED
jgi:hypothetical protein